MPQPRKLQKPDFPWWLVAAGLLAAAAALFIAASDLYAQVFATVAKGIGITIFVTMVAFVLASAIGLGIALMALSGSRLLRQAARFYVEIIRGIPMLVLLFWIAFVGAPALVAAWNFLTLPLQHAGLFDPLLVRDVSLLWRAIIALTIGYSAFIAEVFRAWKTGRRLQKLPLDAKADVLDLFTMAAADWLERETYDLMGINFVGHPNMVRILMTDDWVGHPLRKDYPLQGPDREPYKGRLS